LEPEQIVVVDGADRLKDGAKVRVTRSVAPAAAQPQSQGEDGTAAPPPAPAAAQPGAPANPPQRPEGQRRQRGAPGTFVYVVKPDETVAAQAVTLGPGDDQRIVVTKGLEPGQIVVVDGADRLKDGAKVRVTRSAAPAAAQPQSQGEDGTAAPSPAPAAAQPGAPANPPQRPEGQRRRRGAE